MKKQITIDVCDICNYHKTSSKCASCGKELCHEHTNTFTINRIIMIDFCLDCHTKEMNVVKQKWAKYLKEIK